MPRFLNTTSAQYILMAGDPNTLMGEFQVNGNRVLHMPTNNPDRGAWNPFWSSLAGCKPIYADEEFATSMAGIIKYDNATGTHTTLARLTGQTAIPNTTGNIVRFSYDGLGSRNVDPQPGYGGFQHPITAFPNRTYVQKFMAKLPVGYAFILAENSIGAAPTSYWLTPVAGTGKWEQYIRVAHCGNGTYFAAGPITIVNGGSGYSVGQRLSVVGGTLAPNGFPAILNVDTVSAGVITAVSVFQNGDYTTLPSNPVSVNLGTATFNLTPTPFSNSGHVYISGAAGAPAFNCDIAMSQIYEANSSAYQNLNAAYLTGVVPPAVMVGNYPNITGIGPLTSALTINSGGSALLLKPSTADHVYMEFYARTATPTVRSAYIGYPSPGSQNLLIANDAGGDIIFVRAGNSILTLTAAAVAPASDAAFTLGSSSLKWTGIYMTTPTLGNYLRSNGTSFVSSPLQAGDIPAAALPAFTGEVTKPLGSVIQTIDKNINPIWTNAHVWSRASNGAAVGLQNNRLADPTSNTTHQESPYLFWEARIWDGAAPASRDIYAMVMGISGVDNAYGLRIQSSNVYMALFSGVGGLSVGQASASPVAYMPAGVINAEVGFRVGMGAANGNYLRGNGTNYIGAQLNAGDLVGTLPPTVFTGLVGEVTTPVNSFTTTITRTIAPFWTGSHTWVGAPGTNVINAYTNIQSTSNADHKEGPRIVLGANIWAGSVLRNQDRFIYTRCFGVAGYDDAYGLLIGSGVSQIAMFSSVGGLHIGSSANVAIPLQGTISAQVGFKINNGLAPVGWFLRGDGTNFVNNTIQSADLNGLSPTFANLNCTNFGSCSFTGNYEVTAGNYVRWGHPQQVDVQDGKIGSNLFGSGLNIVGTQTSAGTGRQIRLYGTLIDSAGNTLTTGFAPPSAQIGMTMIPGTATTAMRSDAASAINPSITPAWTGAHSWIMPTTSNLTALSLSSSSAAPISIGTQVNSPFITIYCKTFKTGTGALSRPFYFVVGPMSGVEDNPSFLITNDLSAHNANFSALGGLSIGNNSRYMSAGVINAEAGYRVAGVAPATNVYMKGNGTNFAGSNLNLFDAPNYNQFVYADLQGGAGTLGTENTDLNDGGIGADNILRTKFFRDNGTTFGALGIHVTHSGSSNYALQLVNTAYAVVDLQCRVKSSGTWLSPVTLLHTGNYTTWLQNTAFTWNNVHTWTGNPGLNRIVLIQNSTATSATTHCASTQLSFQAHIWSTAGGGTSQPFTMVMLAAGINGNVDAYGLRLASSQAYCAMFSNVGGLHVGSNAHLYWAPSGVISAEIGFRIANASAAAGWVLRSNGTNYINGQVGAADLSSTGTRDATTFLRGDNVWAVPPGGGGGFPSIADVVTNAAFYPTFASTVSGSLSSANIASSKLAFNPSTGILFATIHSAGAVSAGAPSFSTRSAGTKFIAFDQLGASTVDYAMGIESSYLWFSTPNTSTGFKWYAGTTLWMQLTSGQFVVNVPLSTTSIAVTSNAMVTNLNAQYLGAVGQDAAFFRNAGNLNAGKVPLAQLGLSGTPDATTFLRGDNVWAAPPSGTGGVSLSSQTVAGNPTGATANATSMTVAAVLDMLGTTRGAIVARTTGWITMSPGATNGSVLRSNGTGADLSWSTPSQIIDTIGTTQGSILYRSASGWLALGPGTSGQFLRTTGSGADPVWADVSAGGSPTISDIVTNATFYPTMAGAVSGAFATANITSGKLAFNPFSGVLFASFFSGGTGSVGAPTFGTRSLGARFIVYNQLGASTVDYGMGVEGGALWFSTPDTSAGFKWYAGQTLWATMTSAGLDLVVPLFRVGSNTMVTNLNAQYLGGIGSSGFLTPNSSLDASKLTLNTISTSMLSNSMDNAGNSRGSLWYRGNSGWTALPPATNGMFLKTQGAGNDPIWVSATPGGAPSGETFNTTSIQTGPTSGLTTRNLVNINSPRSGYDIQVFGIDSNSTCAVYTINAVTMNSGTGFAVIQASNIFGSFGGTIAVSSFNGAISVDVTGPGARNIDWRAAIRYWSV